MMHDKKNFKDRLNSNSGAYLGRKEYGSNSFFNEDIMHFGKLNTLKGAYHFE